MPKVLSIVTAEERAWERFRLAALRAWRVPSAEAEAEKERLRREFVAAFLAHYAGEPHDAA